MVMSLIRRTLYYPVRRASLRTAAFVVVGLAVSAAVVVDRASITGQFHRTRAHHPVHVDQIDGTVTFLVRSGQPWFRPNPAALESLTRLQVYEWVDGRLLWEIETEVPRRGAGSMGKSQRVSSRQCRRAVWLPLSWPPDGTAS